MQNNLRMTKKRRTYLGLKFIEVFLCPWIFLLILPLLLIRLWLLIQQLQLLLLLWWLPLLFLLWLWLLFPLWPHVERCFILNIFILVGFGFTVLFGCFGQKIYMLVQIQFGMNVHNSRSDPDSITDERDKLLFLSTFYLLQVNKNTFIRIWFTWR